MTGKKKETKQPNLFGEVDELYNTLQTEKTVILEEIERAEKSMDNLEKKMDELGSRAGAVNRAITTVEKQRKAMEKT